jgi:hypothetical protein
MKKRYAYIPYLITFLLIPALVSGQNGKVQVTEFSIEKDHFREGENLTRVEFKVFTDVHNFTYEFDETTTLLTKVTDETGTDLLEQEESYRDSRPNSSFSPMIQFGGGSRDGFNVALYIHGKPAPGSEVIYFEGQVGLVMMGEEETVHELKALPVAEEDDGEAVESDIGKVWVEYRGKATVD